MTDRWRLVWLSMVITTISATLMASFIVTYTWSVNKKKAAPALPSSEQVVPADNIGLRPQKTLLR